ncbi:class II fructose-bisphosphate aldolase [Micromonospora radicis]|uniref:Class II fructose-bisphosphate aldolase n=1 Tax=Micromonospora radicis TaxID=1894971 RepID=A0A418MPS8_9ACTN|nr:class II fructose-bisphosphate aldolase [Micromonospora radicis]RIV34582.1 class II fructose-bisphosphate aldolase [Micromonospora radicis]
MPLAETLDLVRAAQAGKYAVPAVNIVDELSIRAVVSAASRAGSPVILQTSVKTVKLSGAAVISAIVRAVAQDADVPVSLHLDHCPDPAVVTEAIANGWSSVLYDASHLDFDEALATTRAVTLEAHAAGVSVESEIENIVGVEDGVGSDLALHGYTIEQLVDAAEITGVDMLAPALGTSHGLYTSEPTLQFARARELRGRTDLPVVLHGGTGLTADQFREFIDAGIAKINISTALKRAYMEGARDHLVEAERTGKWEPTALFRAIDERIEPMLTEHMEMFGSAQHARLVTETAR